MILKIESDYQRFRKIIRGSIKKNLRKFMSTGELIGRKGKNIVSIPLPQIELPRFKYGPKEKGGVGQGDGDVGTPISQDEGDGSGKAGNIPADHILEADITMEELAAIMAEELELPRIEPKGKNRIIAEKEKYTGVHRAGPESLRIFKRTYREALKRQIMTGSYDASNPLIIPTKEDKRYRSWRLTYKPESNAVIFYLMDVSGSMGNEQKEIVRIEAFWIDTWLRSQYKGIVSKYIIHDAVAREVDEETFYHTRESGGTVISTSYNLLISMIEKDFHPSEWNIYVFQFSDGDNWSGDDTSKCISLLSDPIFKYVNLFCYGQVESQYGSGQFLKDLTERLDDEEKIVTSKIESKDRIYDSIRDFFKKGK